MSDVLPGQHRLVLTGAGRARASVTVTAQPGQQVSNITIGPQKPAAETDTLVETLSAATASHAAFAVRGRVTDANYRPVAGADVYAVCSSSGGMGRRDGQKVLASKTDAAGAYLISGLPTGDGQTGPSVHLIACQPGFGLAVGDGQSEKGQLSGRWMDIQKDLVLPGSHSGLMVQVLQNGKPCPNVLVSLARARREFRDTRNVPRVRSWRGGNSSSSNAGSQRTDRARRRGLVHGPDAGLVGRDREPNTYPNLLSDMPVPPFNVSTGIIVQAGETHSYTVSLIPPPADVAFHVVGPNRLPLPTVPASVSVTTAHDPNYGNISLAPDGSGNGRGTFVVPGLFSVTARVGDKPLDLNALAGPYFEGTALVAVSAATPASRPIILPARRVGPASIRVRLLDAQGKPLRGTVTVGDPFNSALYAASVDRHGIATFANIPLNFFPYTVTAHILGQPERVVPSRQDGLLPSDAALIAGTGQPLPQVVRVQGGEETVVTFGQEPPGYVRLRVTGPFASAKDYYIEGRQSNDEPFTETHFDPASGEYLLGPLPAGRRTFHLFRYVGGAVATNLNVGEVVVTVKAGQVVRAAVAAQSTAAQEPLYSSPLMGTVYLPDGKTPAWGAQAALFLPDWPVPRLMARTDTQGRLTLRDFWRSSARSGETPPGNPNEPVLVAWLPGANGAVIVPFHPGRDERLVLPAPVSLQGRVTVGGRAVLGLPSQFRVRAAYQGKGRLNEALSVEATAQADGTFTLAGLTPGTYQVQASRDNIWLSKTQTVIVGAAALPEMALDIAPPGVSVTLRLEDSQGKPRPGQEVRIVRPDGPLTDEIWPTKLISDSKGLLRVDGLEAGHHFAIITDRMAMPGQAGESIGFDVAAWTPTAPPVTHRIVLTPTP